MLLIQLEFVTPWFQKLSFHRDITNIQKESLDNFKIKRNEGGYALRQATFKYTFINYYPKYVCWFAHRYFSVSLKVRNLQPNASAGSLGIHTLFFFAV